jgi:hypothetical protein
MRGTAAYAGFVVVTTLLGGCPATPDGPPERPTGSAASRPQSADGIRAPLRYSPTWLPPGLVERDRYLSAGEGRDPFRDGEGAQVRRMWSSASSVSDDGPRPGLVISVIDKDYVSHIMCPEGSNVDINGVRGHAPDADTSNRCVRWRPDPDTTIVVRADGVRLGREDLLQVARSMRQDKGQLVLPLQVDRMDDIFHASALTSAHFSAVSAANWWATISTVPVAKSDPRDVEVRLGTGTPSPAGGTALTVGGRPARYRTDTARVGVVAYLVVEVDGGLLLTVKYSMLRGDPPPMADLTRIAERVKVGRPDVSWIGTRPG